MIRIEGIPVLAARLAAELKSTKTVENPTRFRRQRIRPSRLPVPQQPSGPAGHGRMHKSAHSGKGEKEMPQWRPDQTFYPSHKNGDAGLAVVNGASSVSKPMKKLTFIFALAVLARGQDAMSLKEAVRQSMARSKVIEASGASRDAASARVTEARVVYCPK